MIRSWVTNLSLLVLIAIFGEVCDLNVPNSRFQDWLGLRWGKMISPWSPGGENSEFYHFLCVGWKTTAYHVCSWPCLACSGFDSYNAVLYDVLVISLHGFLGSVWGKPLLYILTHSDRNISVVSTKVLGLILYPHRTPG